MTTKIDIFSGFLGAGKTTLIKKLIAEAYTGEKLVLIENEFGDIAIDGGFLQDAGIEIREMSSGCICCSLVGDFAEALSQVMEKFAPDRILIEPSGVGKLSDVAKAVQGCPADIELNALVTVVDATKCKMYMKNFGEFFNNQVEHASAIVLSRTDSISEIRLHAAVTLLKEHNPQALVVTTPWDQLSGSQLLAAIEGRDTLAAALAQLEEEDVCPICGEHHDHDHHHEHEHEHEHDHEHDHEHEHHHDHDHEHEHHHDHEHEHDHDHEHEHEHDHDHEHDHEHHHDHEHGHDHHHHHADEIFGSWGRETAVKFDANLLQSLLEQLEDEERFGTVLRAKGIVDGGAGWLHFDFVPGEISVRPGAPGVTGRLCVIGSHLKEEALAQLFGV
ncbi:MAG: GTP-binding protein [Firmicutes bacterium]|nr:GTP-binding protein [Bacillota bacterium]